MPPVRYHAGQFPPKMIDWERLIPLIGPASAAVARYEGVLEAVPNPDVLLSPLTTNETVVSSRIEGTQATLGEVLEFEAAAEQSEASGEKRADINEVLNYRAALYDAVAALELYRREKEWIARATRSQHVIAALDWVFSRPVFSTSDFLSSARIPKAAAKRILSIARTEGRLRELRPASGRRAAILAFPGLLNIAEGREVF